MSDKTKRILIGLVLLVLVSLFVFDLQLRRQRKQDFRDSVISKTIGGETGLAIKAADPAAYGRLEEKLHAAIDRHLQAGGATDAYGQAAVAQEIGPEIDIVAGRYMVKGSDEAILSLFSATADLLDQANRQPTRNCIDLLETPYSIVRKKSESLDLGAMDRAVAQAIRSYRAERSIPTASEVAAAGESLGDYLLQQYGEEALEVMNAEPAQLDPAQQRQYCEMTVGAMRHLVSRREAALLRRMLADADAEEGGEE